jgi:hypothetical protein
MLALEVCSGRQGQGEYLLSPMCGPAHVWSRKGFKPNKGPSSNLHWWRWDRLGFSEFVNRHAETLQFVQIEARRSSSALAGSVEETQPRGTYLASNSRRVLRNSLYSRNLCGR